MSRGLYFRCFPTPAQQHTLMQWIGCQRFIYNAKVTEYNYFRRFQRHSLMHAGLHAPCDQAYSQFKSELTPFLNDVPSEILRNGATRFGQASSRFFAKLGGRPKHHKKQANASVWITKELFHFEPIPDGSGYRLFLGKANFRTQGKHPLGD